MAARAPSPPWRWPWLAGADAGLIAGFAAVLGHNFPVWLKFKGGKGVATTLGVLLITGLAGRPRRLPDLAGGRRAVPLVLTGRAGRPRRCRRSWRSIFATPAARLDGGGLAVLGAIRHRANIRRIISGPNPRSAEEAGRGFKPSPLMGEEITHCDFLCRFPPYLGYLSR